MVAASFFIFIIYLGIAGFSLWLAWQFVQAVVSIARSLEDIAGTYRTSSSNPITGGSGPR